MFTLIDNVIGDRFFVSRTAGKSAIFLSPTTELWEIGLLFCPLAATLLNISHEITQRYCWGQLNEHVYMVTDAIDAIKATTTALYY